MRNTSLKPVLVLFWRSVESTSWVPRATQITEMMPMRATMKANQNQPFLSPEPDLVTEKKRTIGMITTPTMLPPMVEPTRAKVAVFSRSSELKVRAGTMDQKLMSLKE